MEEVSLSHELFEVVNAFPVLKTSFSHLRIPPSEVKEGETVEEFFNRLNFSESEAKIVLKRVNRDLKYFFTKGKLPYRA